MCEENIKNDVTEPNEPEAPKKEKKKSKKESEIEKLQAELDAKNDLLVRTAAEFDNYKKRTERERLAISEFAKAQVIKQLLPILDNIDRAAAVEKDTPDYIKGIEMIVKQFETIADNIGIEQIAAEGDQFDPNFHEAVMHVEDEELAENVIEQVLQKGDKLGDTVNRAAMVKVAN